MSRFLSTGIGEESVQEVENPFANKVLPNTARSTAGLEPYSGAWGTEQVKHLIRRSMFGARKQDISTLSAQSMSTIVEMLLQPGPAETSQPLNTDSRDLVPVGQTWVDAAYNDPNSTFNPTGTRRTSLKAWWTSLMLNQSISLREKMVLFWHNHFVTETIDVNDPRLSYRYTAALRSNALGNFKTLTKLVTLDMAMLRYLSGATSTKQNPNENYARELQELFTIGKGPEVAPGDYTNYTETDVQAAAKVLTGYRVDATSLIAYFDPTRHDTTNKQFSNRYGNTVITGRTGADGALELDDLLTMIFNQAETAKFLCRKLYRWFVYYVIDDGVEANIIVPMANILRSNNYDVIPALRALFSSAHFYDPNMIGCVIKNPLDHLIGMCRTLPVAFPPSDVIQQYTMWNYVRNQAATMQMDAGDPPNVAGWTAYYQIPQYHEQWINSDTLPKRDSFTDRMAREGFTSGGFKLVVDQIAFALSVSNPADANAIINEWSDYLFPIPITDNQKAFLNDTLLPGLPDYEWTAEWNAYIADPTNTAKRNAVRSKLQTLLSFMMSMAEYHLS